jgi:hypothetical protein
MRFQRKYFCGNLISINHFHKNLEEPLLFGISCKKNRLSVDIREIKWVHLEITVTNKVPSENIPAGISFLTVISRAT